MRTLRAIRCDVATLELVHAYPASSALTRQTHMRCLLTATILSQMFLVCIHCITRRDVTLSGTRECRPSITCSEKSVTCACERILIIRRYIAAALGSGLAEEYQCRDAAWTQGSGDLRQGVRYAGLFQQNRTFDQIWSSELGPAGGPFNDLFKPNSSLTPGSFQVNANSVNASIAVWLSSKTGRKTVNLTTSSFSNIYTGPRFGCQYSDPTLVRSATTMFFKCLLVALSKNATPCQHRPQRTN